MSANEQDLVKQNKLLLGPITLMDCSDIDTASAHRLLGQDARAQIHKILFKRLDDLGGREQLAGKIRRARRVQSTLTAKLLNPDLNDAIKAAVRQYQACLSAWAEGAALENFCHPFLSETIDGSTICAEDLATILQAEEVGCQTGVLREHNGSVILWHSEEDSEDSPVFGQRFDKLRLFIFRAANGHKACGFIYPDLLPGPTFGWQDDNFVQAIDTLHVRSVEFENGAITPNTLTWLSLYLGTLVSRKALCEATLLGPFYGGYSLTAAYKKDGRVSVEKVEFANDQAAACELETTTGKTFFQTNVIRDLSQPIGAEELTSPESRAWNEKRMARAARFIKVIQKSAPRFAKQIATRSGSANRTGTTTEEASDPRDHSHVSMVFRMMQSRLGDESANSNRDVKAYLVCHMSTEKTSIWVGPGAPVSGDELFSFEM